MSVTNFRAESLIPPQNIEIEEAVLGGILLDPEAIERIIDKLTPQAFYISTHGDIYKACATLNRQGKPVDLLTVTDYLIDQKQLEKIGGQAKLIQILERTVSAVNIDSLATVIIEKYTRRQLIEAGSKIQSQGHDTFSTIEESLDRSEQAIYNISANRTGNKLTSLRSATATTIQEIDDRRLNCTPPGLTCGFLDLDGMTGGFSRGDLIIVAGRPSMGKTSLGMQIGYNIADKHRLPVLIFSMEMSQEQLVQRLIASEAGVDSSRLRAGRVSISEWESVQSAIAAMNNLPIYIDDTSDISVAGMRAQARRACAETGKPLGMILLDYIQLMGNGASENRVEELSKITRGLKGLAREFKVPVVALSQLSRGVESRNDKRPMMSDLRSSGSIEQDADIIIMIYRDSYYNTNSTDPKTELIVNKNRNGPTGTVKMIFDPALTKFKNIARP
jgi:replicative DNA helicase